MPGNADGLRTLAEISRLPVHRIRYVADADADTVQSIDNGILFLMAFWSGAARLGFIALTEGLRDAAPADLELVVADLDGSPILYEIPELSQRIHGYGEAAFVRQRRVAHAAAPGRGAGPICCKSNVRAFLSECGLR